MPAPSTLEAEHERTRAAMQERERSFPSLPPLRSRRYDEEPPPRRRRRVWLWLAILVVGVAGVFGASQMYPRLNQYGLQLSRLRGLQGALDGIGNRISEAESDLAAIPARMDSLRERLGRMDQKFAAGLEQARRNTRDMAAGLRREMLATVTAQLEKVDTRLDHLEAGQRTETERLALIEQQNTQLQQQISDLNGRLTSVGQNVTQEISAVQSDTAHETQQIRDQISQTEGRVTRVAGFTDRPRLQFEAGLGRTQPIAPGILFRVTRTDPVHDRFSGVLQLMNDGKTLHLRDQNVRQSVAFFTGRDALRNDLVVTAVNPGGLAGVVILPSRGESESAQPRRPAAAGL